MFRDNKKKINIYAFQRKIELQAGTWEILEST